MLFDFYYTPCRAYELSVTNMIYVHFYSIFRVILHDAQLNISVSGEPNGDSSKKAFNAVSKSNEESKII
jgi:hypothetical protein